jgi:GT2 family glycosyltransferase
VRTAVIVPTRRRAAYLDVALATIAPQATAEGAELLVVDDGPDEATRSVAVRHGARLLTHPGSRGLNAARNTAIAATGADLLVFVDDDVAVRPGWLRALRAAAAALPDDVGVLAGPIHARFEDHRVPLCGREGPPITFLDLGPEDRDAEHAWGANMTVRRSALQRVGLFDERLGLYGDEQEWQDRLKATGGRVRYVAAAGVDHRRVGDDARLRALCRAAFARGVASRRNDARAGAAPSLAAELRVLAGCLVHGPRFACANGPVLSAHALGRLRAALAPALADPTQPDFLSGTSGHVAGRRGALRRARDRGLDVLAAPRRARLRAAGRRRPPRRRVLVLGVERPRSLMPAARAELARSRHDVEVHTAPPAGRGRFENLNALLAAHPVAGFDWLVLLDDDVALPRGFLDAFLAAAEDAGLRLAQPAHRLHSHAAWPVTRRRAGSAVRETTFVEIGPVTAFRRDTFATLLPFPPLRMGWGLDVHWAALARERGWRLGVVDATPIAHTVAPVATGYSRAEAAAEARAFLAGRAYVRRDEVRTLAVHR